MKYGIENIFIGEPLSLILSIFLLLGISYFGIVFQRHLKKKYNFIYVTNYFFSPVLGTYIVIFFLYPITLLGLNNIFFLKSITFILLLFGILFFVKIIKKLITNFKFDFKKNYIVYISFSTLFFIAAAPITHADSIYYHLNSAANILSSGTFSTEILPFEDKIAGSGEIIIALGLSFGLSV